MASNNVIETDVVVVGAGISGLTAAYELATRTPLSVRVLEALDRLGGRTRVVTLKGHNGLEESWDVGAQFVGHCQPHIMEVLKKFDLGLNKVYVDGIKMVQLAEGPIRSYSTSIPNLSILAMLDMFLFLRKIQSMCDEIDVYNPYSHPRAAVWDSMTLQEFTRSRAWTNALIQCLEAATRCIFGKETSQISLLHYLYYIKAGGGIDALLESSNGAAQEFTIKGGTGALVEKLAEGVKNNNNNVIELKCPVTKIEQSPEKIMVYTEMKNSDGEDITYQCKYCILAIPPHMMGHISFIPDLPSDKRELIKYMQPGNLTKVIFTYKQAFWRKKKFSGEALCANGPVCVVYDNSSACIPSLMAFVGGDQMVQWRQVEEPVFVKAVLTCLEKFFGSEVNDFISVASMDWAQEPYILGSPTSVIVPGAMKYFPNMRKPFNRLIFAGTETATQSCGYMSGAVQTGLRSAREVMFLLDCPSLTAEDLSDTAFRQEELNRSKHRRRKMFSWTNKVVGVGIGLTAGIAAWKIAAELRR